MGFNESDSEGEEVPQQSQGRPSVPPGLRNEDIPALFWCVNNRVGMASGRHAVMHVVQPATAWWGPCGSPPAPRVGLARSPITAPCRRCAGMTCQGMPAPTTPAATPRHCRPSWQTPHPTSRQRASRCVQQLSPVRHRASGPPAEVQRLLAVLVRHSAVGGGRRQLQPPPVPVALTPAPWPAAEPRQRCPQGWADAQEEVLPAAGD